MCGGFNCSKNALALLNIIFLLVSFLLIGVASYARAAAIIHSFEIVGGILASGLFLFLISFLGLIAGYKHHQVLLFFYIVVLFLLFVIQFSVSIACLAVSEKQVSDTLEGIWETETKGGIENDTIKLAQTRFKCCGWDIEDQLANSTLQHCQEQNVCLGVNSVTQATVITGTTPTSTACATCDKILPATVSQALEACGGIGLFFSFAEMLGVWLAVRFRNQKDPKANPSEFL